MPTKLRLKPMTAAVCGALALTAPARAQTFDPNSPAVRQAYVGAATQEKRDAALAGIKSPVNQVLQSIGPNSRTIFVAGNSSSFVQTTIDATPSPSRYLVLAGDVNDAFKLRQISGLTPSPTIIQAANDSDLGAPGAAVTLNNSRLEALASFNTARNFTIGELNGTVHTQGFNLGISGNINGTGALDKIGSGSLTLTGNNTYAGGTTISAGTLSVGADINLGNPSGTINLNGGTLRATGSFFSQRAINVSASGSVIDTGANTISLTGGSLSGAHSFNKIGSGTLLFGLGFGTGRHSNGMTLQQGTLSLQSGLAATFGTIKASDAIIDYTTIGISNNAAPIQIVGNNLRLQNLVGPDVFQSGVISEDAPGRSIEKIGAGTLVLTGNNTYTGATTISAGNLEVGRGTTGSVGSGSVINNATLTFGRTDTMIVNNTISGTGHLVQRSSGTLILTGNNTYSGATSIDSGTLQVGDGGTNGTLGSGDVVNNGNLHIDRSGTVVVANKISGTGFLRQNGAGTTILTGNNTYSGITGINSGTLQVGNGGTTGTLGIGAVGIGGLVPATLAFNRSDTLTISNNIIGGSGPFGGAVCQIGSGTTILSGINSYRGGTTITAGTLRIYTDVNLGATSGALVMGGGTLQIGADIATSRNIGLGTAGGIFDTDGHQFTVNGGISGSGNLIKSGTGTLALNGTNVYTGATTVSAGRLEVNGAIDSNVTVTARGELGGGGLIAGNLIRNHGRLARGSVIGDIQTQGNVAFEPGSLFTVKANTAGSSDRLVVVVQSSTTSGRLTLSGGTVELLAESGNYRPSTRYHIVATEGGVNGQFAGVTSNLAFLNPSLSYDTNNVYLTLRRNDASFASVAQTANQQGVAQSLTRLTNNATGDATIVTAALDGLSAQQARAAFDSIGSAGRALIPQSLNVNQRAVNQNLVARLGLADRGNSLAPATGIAGRGVQLAYEESSRSDATPVYAQLGLPAGQGFRSSQNDGNNGLWLRAYGGSGRLDGDANAPGAKYHYGGTLLGFDHKINNTTTLGLFAGYAQPRYNQDAATSSAKAKTWQLGAYGRYTSGAWHVDGVASYARNDTDTSRVVSVGGLSRVAAGSFDGDAWNAHLETGYTIKAGGFEVQPLAALSWVRQNQNAYAETGAGALNLILPDQSQASLRSSLGLRTLHPFTTSGMQWVFETRAAWAHEFKTARTVNARLAGDPAAGVFALQGPDVPRDSAVLGVGLAAQASKNLRLYADVNAEFNGASRAYAVSAGLRYQW